ncbi:zinc finger protein-like [Tropilaelaps mercedesae]|uniref:Zinc finger protein-like n=1 Tax=Tropilaelaps mercedesae TaxID=418985 RepID=A0A1V9WZH6_9ACAR|nr:zinc finger protein-like [Tropilaelaps mercedesae]
MDGGELATLPVLSSPPYAICYESSIQTRNGNLPTAAETEISPLGHSSVSVLSSAQVLRADAHDDTVADSEVLDFENAILLTNSCVIEVQGARHVLHIDYDARQVLAVPLRPQSTNRQNSTQNTERSIDATALGSLLGRRSRGRPRKGHPGDAKVQVSLLLLSPGPSPTLLVQIPIEDVPPLLPQTALCERVLATMLSRDCEATNASFDVPGVQGELTLNADVAVFDGAPNWVQTPVVIPLDKSDPVEDETFLRERAVEPVHDELLDCASCGFQSYYEAHLSEHLLREHAAEVGQSGFERCSKCDLHLANRDALVSHYSRRHPHLVCELCGVIFEQRYLMRKHNERHDETAPNRCELCGKIYKDRYILKNHVKLVHGQAEVFYQCDMCRKQFERKAHLVRHMRTHTDDVKPFPCDQCSYRARERGDLNKHLRGHGEPSFHCGQCSKSFTHLKSLRLHEKRHGGVRDYRCGLCDFSAFTYNHVRKHIERTHAGSVNATAEVFAGVG